MRTPRGGAGYTASYGHDSLVRDIIRDVHPSTTRLENGALVHGLPAKRAYNLADISAERAQDLMPEAGAFAERAAWDLRERNARHARSSGSGRANRV